MNISLFGYTIEVYKSKYGRKLARKILAQSHSYTSNQAGYKIALIKALRIDQDISLKDAKDAVESMFDFDDNGRPRIK
jgi:ribosomal protein L7/L12